MLTFRTVHLSSSAFVFSQRKCFLLILLRADMFLTSIILLPINSSMLGCKHFVLSCSVFCENTLARKQCCKRIKQDLQSVAVKLYAVVQTGKSCFLFFFFLYQHNAHCMIYSVIYVFLIVRTAAFSNFFVFI